ncbi:bifunctional dTTP UTP pyrophosphatase methyltransferase [Octopus vulgaris]|uniref:Acetylserotonin O-methyltransferase n=2 Tax=Octopus TaxID=6643 RepID=A0AA36FGV0_OCTVU|nr:bifunctional dTTP UTP pyrophosphatase methyltransferase [Octopus vulgaris]
MNRLENSINQAGLASDPEADVIMKIITSARNLKILMYGLEVGLFDEIESNGEPLTAAGIARKFNYDKSTTERFLNTLVSLDLLDKEVHKGNVVYSNTAGTTKYLTRSRRPALIASAMSEFNVILPLLSNLTSTLKSGKAFIDMANIKAGKMLNNENPPMKNIHIEDQKDTAHNKGSHTESSHTPGVNCTNGVTPNGTNGISANITGTNGTHTTNGTHPDKASNGSKPAMDCSAMIMLSMDGLTVPCAPVLVKAFDLSAHRTAVDLGGGSGLIGRTLASHYPEMNITVFDLPSVVQLAKKLYPENSSGQVNFVAGNFFEDEIPDADLYVLSHVIHDMTEKQIDILLKRVYNKLPPGGSLLILEKTLDEMKDGPSFAVSNDLIMSLISTGRERSAKEYREMLEEQGFTNIQIRLVGGYNYFDAILSKKPF